MYINREIEKLEREKSQYRARNSIWELPLSFHTFYELLFPKFIAMDSDGEVVITKFPNIKWSNRLSEYYDSDYTETESSSSETDSSDSETDFEVEADNVSRPIIYGQAFNSDPISALNEIFDINNLDAVIISSEDFFTEIISQK